MNNKAIEAKGKAIEEAWKNTDLRRLVDDITPDGWYKCKPGQYDSAAIQAKFNRMRMNSQTHYIRPYSLEGIDTNNGWNFIDWDDPETLPEGEETVMWLRNEGEPAEIASMLDVDFKEGYSTHWRPINILPPIY